MAKRQNTHILETEKVYCVIMTFHKIAFALTKFDLVRIKGSGINGEVGGELGVIW